VAKKARRKLEEETEESSFQFPEFDEGKFLAHEFEQTIATLLAVVLGLVLAVVAWAWDRYLAGPLPVLLVVPLILGIAVIAFSPFFVPRLRPAAADYTRGDWAGLIVIQLFGWLGLWFLLLNVLPS
jgi:hypothetical protein